MNIPSPISYLHPSLFCHSSLSCLLKSTLFVRNFVFEIFPPHYFLPLNQCFSLRGRGSNLPPRRHLSWYGDIFDCHDWGGSTIGIWYGGAGDAAGHLKMHRTASPTTMSYQVQKVNSANIEETCSKDMKSIRLLTHKHIETAGSPW